MHVVLAVCLVFSALFVSHVARASDTTAYATPDPPPSLPGRGHTMVDPVFGSTVIQLSDATDSAFSVGLSYSSHFAMNYNSTYFLGLYNTAVGAGVWKTTEFNPTTYAVTASTSLPTNCKFDPQRWDVSGTAGRSSILYCFSEGSAATNRQLREWDAAAHSLSLPFADFEVDLRRTGTITSATDSSHFAASAYVSPVTDMAVHFEVGQVVTFATSTCGLAGQTQTITGFTDAGGAFTTNAFTATPCVGDTFYARPSGFPSEFNVSPDGRYFIAGLQQSNVSGIGGSDTGHILLVYDRTANQKYVHYFSLAAFGGPSECVTKCGWHQMQIDKAPGSHYIWASIGSVTDVLIDFIAGTVVHLYPDALGHADTSVDSRIITTAGVAAQAKMAYYAAADPGTLVDVLTTVTKCGLTDNNTGRHTSWSLDATKILASTYLTPPNSGGNQAVANTKWVADGVGTNIYRMDNFSTQMTTMCPLTPTNLGEVWDNQDKLTYMGTTKASIVASGQWAFDPNGSSGKGQLWVRGKVDSVLTDSAQTTRISAFDWRLFLDEITLVYTDELPGNTQKWTRLAKAFSRTSGIGASETSWTPRASLSPDGHFAVFTSTWGNRVMNGNPSNPPRRDLFAVVIGAAPTPDAPSAPTGVHISSDGTITWLDNTDATLAGYRVYRGTSPGVYDLLFDRTPALAASQHSPLTRVIDHPSVGTTYYYAVSAYLANGNESTTSVEVSRVVVGQTARAVRQ